MISHSKAQASKNLDLALAPGRRFPSNPFLGQWDAFYFFEPHRLFLRSFPDTMRALLASENGSSVCMRNMDGAPVVDPPEGASDSPEGASLSLDGSTSGEAYWKYLRGSGPGFGWLSRMERYAYASDAGHWCIYCERNNEIAVIAIRENGARFASALEQLGALPIGRAIESSVSWGLSLGHLPEAWREELLRAYAPKE